MGKPSGSSNATVAMEGAEVEVTGDSAKGNPVTGADFTSKGTADAQGSVTLQLPASGSKGYSLYVKDVAVGGKTYTQDTDGFTFSVSSSGVCSLGMEYTGMSEQTNSYPVQIQVTDQGGTKLNISGANLSLGAKTVSGAEFTETGTAEFNIQASGSQNLSLGGLQGYQAISNAPIIVTPQPANSKDNAEFGIGDVSGIPAKFSVDSTKKIITIQLKKTTTKVDIPIKKPDDYTGNASDMTVRVTPVPGTENTDVPASGLVIQDAVKVDGDKIVASPELPDGAYEVIIGGTGITSIKTTVTVITTYDSDGVPTRVVNVGGTPTIDTSTKTPTGAAGGVTAVKEESSANPDGNGAVDLTGQDKTTGGTTTITDGGTVDTTSGTPNVTGGTGLTGNQGLLDSTDTTLIDSLTPSTDQDPAYYVEVTADPNGDSTRYTSMTAKVYLRNTKASSGTFGMYFDTSLFTNATVALETDKIEYAPSNGISPDASAEIQTDPTGKADGYVLFSWQTPNANSELNAIGADVLLATITLTTNTAVNTISNFESIIDNRSIYTMDFKRTAAGKKIEKEYRDNDAAAETPDPAETTLAINEAINSIWRVVGNDGLENSVHILDDNQATRGGFYQTYTNGTIPAAGDTSAIVVAHDTKMIFKLPDFINKQRVDFWVSDPDVGISQAKIFISETETPLNDVTLEMTEADLTAIGVKLLLTDADGYAHYSAEVGDKLYYYRVLEKSHWAYPDGTTAQDPTKTIDSYRVVKDFGGSPQSEVYPQGSGHIKTPVVNGCINPRMIPQTFHEVVLKGGGTATANATITSQKTAYNQVMYYFSVDPGPGKTWDVGSGKTYADMPTLAAAITATLYAADKDTTDTLEHAFQTKLLDKDGTDISNKTVSWDNGRQMFVINGGDITGDGIGEVTGGTIEGETIDPLRAGNLLLKLKDDMVADASYTITATSGTGGTVAYKMPSVTPSVGSSNLSGDLTAQTAPIVEELSGGRTYSGEFTFTPDTTAPSGFTAPITIDKVFINGVEQTISALQKEQGFTYQFLNVAEDQDIYVTYVDKDGNPISNPYITLDVGANGKVDVTGKKGDSNAATPLTPTPITGPGSASYVVDPDNADKLVLTVTPSQGDVSDTTDDYEIDQILVDGVPQSKGTPDGDGYYTAPATVDIPLALGETHSVVVTFKPKGQDSTQVVVTSSVKEGLGSVTPVGTKIWPVGATPDYILNPADGWEVLDGQKRNNKEKYSVMLDGQAPTAAFGLTDTGSGWKYTFGPLTADVKLEVTFFEKTIKVYGQIKLAAGVTQTKPVDPADLTFFRAADPAKKIDEATVPLQSGTTVSTGQLISFEADVPVGTWDLTVEKQGYLDYIITGFTINAGDNHVHFGSSSCDRTATDGTTCADASTMKPIEMMPGDAAGEGLTVAFNDAAVVIAGWINGATTGNQKKGDIDENRATGTGSDSTDMGYVKNNMYKKRAKIKYSTFSA